MAYRIIKKSGKRPYVIMKGKKAVGTSTSKVKATKSIKHRELAEASKKPFKRKVDNKMRDYGETDFGKRQIKVNKKKSKKSPTHKRAVNKHASKYPEVLDTIVHEETHAAHPKMHERTVRKKTRQAMSTLTKRKKAQYYAKYK